MAATLCKRAAKSVLYVDENTPVLHFGRVGMQVVAGRWSFDLIGHNVKHRRMPWAFNRVFDCQPVAHMHIPMGTEAIGQIYASSRLR